MPVRLLDPQAIKAYAENGECDDCRWPDVCERDGTCWHLERPLGVLRRAVLSDKEETKP